MGDISGGDSGELGLDSGVATSIIGPDNIEIGLTDHSIQSSEGYAARAMGGAPDVDVDNFDPNNPIDEMSHLASLAQDKTTQLATVQRETSILGVGVSFDVHAYQGEQLDLGHEALADALDVLGIDYSMVGLDIGVGVISAGIGLAMGASTVSVAVSAVTSANNAAFHSGTISEDTYNSVNFGVAAIGFATTTIGGLNGLTNSIEAGSAIGTVSSVVGIAQSVKGLQNAAIAAGYDVGGSVEDGSTAASGFGADAGTGYFGTDNAVAFIDSLAIGIGSVSMSDINGLMLDPTDYMAGGTMWNAKLAGDILFDATVVNDASGIMDMDIGLSYETRAFLFGATVVYENLLPLQFPEIQDDMSGINAYDVVRRRELDVMIKEYNELVEEREGYYDTIRYQEGIATDEEKAQALIDRMLNPTFGVAGYDPGGEDVDNRSDYEKYVSEKNVTGYESGDYKAVGKALAGDIEDYGKWTRGSEAKYNEPKFGSSLVGYEDSVYGKLDTNENSLVDLQRKFSEYS